MLEYPFIPITERRPFTWPGGKRVAVVATVPMEYFEVGGGKIYAGGPALLPAPVPYGLLDFPNHTWREYGHRVGIWRIMKVLDAVGVPVSGVANPKVFEQYPAILDAVRERSWDLSAAHGYVENTSLHEMADDPRAHRDYIKLSLDAHEKVVGSSPHGWISPAGGFLADSFEILADEGVRWIGGCLNDDLPFLASAGGKELVAVPHNTELNDYTIFTRGHELGDGYKKAVLRHVSCLADEAAESGVPRVVAVPAHPHVFGQPFRIGILDETLRELRERDDVWWTTLDELASTYQRISHEQGETMRHEQGETR